MIKEICKKALEVALFEPRIPPNTGCIARSCAAFKLPLHLIEPLGFSLEDRYLKRAGLDYWPYIDLTLHSDFYQFKTKLQSHRRIIACSRYGGVPLRSMKFQHGDVLLFGREDTGLPEAIRAATDEIVSIPMPGSADDHGKGGVRSLNIAVAQGLISFEAGHQLGLW